MPLRKNEVISSESWSEAISISREKIRAKSKYFKKIRIVKYFSLLTYCSLKVAKELMYQYQYQYQLGIEYRKQFLNSNFVYHVTKRGRFGLPSLNSKTTEREQRILSLTMLFDQKFLELADGMHWPLRATGH